MSGLFGGGAKASSAPPALGSLNIQQSSYGTPVTLMYGTNRITGNMLWYDDFKSVQVSNSGGGKGGGGGGGGKGGSGSGQYDYYTSFILGMCEGPIDHIGQVWESKTITNIAALGGTVFVGNLSQSPWGYLTTFHPDKALGYNKTAYVGFPNYYLGGSAETPNLAMEIFASPDATTPSKQDAWPSTVIPDFLTRAAWPTAYLANFTGSAFDVYTKAMSFAFSPICDQQQTTVEWLNQWIQPFNCEFVWADGVLSIIPYGDAPVSGNGQSYTPNLTPQYDLSDDDFIVAGDEDPITCTRTDLADAYNQMPIEYVNKNNSYNIETYTAEDAAHIDMFGIRTASTVQAHHITDPNVAQIVASLVLWRQLYVRTTYQFKLGWRHILLDPMDLVTLTDANLGLNKTLVRITDIEEDENGMLTMTAEEMPGDIAAPALYATQTTDRYSPDYNADPGDANAPVVFEAPLALIQKSEIEVWFGTSGASPNWGGYQVYVSTDGVSYQYLDRVLASARQGVLTAILPTSTTAIDSANTLAVDLTESLGVIGSAAPADANNLNTLSYVDGEFLAYGNVALTATNKYNLTYLQRGAYGSTIGAHAIGKPFMRLDQSVYKYPVDQSRIGQKIYFKFISFNLFGGALQTLSEVPAYDYTITGAALLTALPNPTNVSVSYLNGIAQLNWTPVSDIRSPILYQIRKGATFASAQIVDVTTQSSYPVYGNDTYWITALFYTPLGVAVYSASPPSIAVTTASITQNLIETWEESTADGFGTGPWGGACTGHASVSGSSVIVSGGLTGTYTAPAVHEIASNYIVNAKVIFSWHLSAVSLTSDVTAIADVTTTPDITGLVNAALVRGTPQIQLSQDGGATWSAWQNWTPGVYTFNKINYRILLQTFDATVEPVLSQFSIEVDVPLRIENGSALGLTGGDKTVAFSGGLFNVSPQVQLTIQNPSAGDDVRLVSQSTTGFVFSVYNSGARVARTVNYSAQSY